MNDGRTSATAARPHSDTVGEQADRATREPRPPGTDAILALQRAAGNRATRQLLARRPLQRKVKPAAAQKKALPPVRVQPDQSRSGGWGWRLQFETWVFRHELLRALFKSGALPAGFTLEPTRKTEAGANFSLRWTLSWRGPLEAHVAELTDFAKQLRQRAQGEGEEFDEDTWRREAAEEAARVANREHNKQFVPALGMTGAEALRTLKPGVYVAAPGRPLRPIPPPSPDNRNPDVSWMFAYRGGGVFVWVGGTTEATRIHIREIGPHEQFWKHMIWYMQRGDDLATAEKNYIRLWDELNRMMIGAFALALTTAPSIGPRANVIKPAGAGRSTSRNIGATGTKSTLGHVNPTQALAVVLQAYGVMTMVHTTIEDAQARDEAQAAHARGDLFQLPVFVSESADLEPAPATGATAGRKLARTKKGTGKKRSMRERVQGFVDAVADRYRSDIAAQRKAKPTATPSVIGIEAEKATLAKVPELARKWKLDPNRIWLGTVPVGVTGPKGGVISAEMASKYYKFMIELKKSPKAVKGYQATAQLLALEHGANFPHGGRYFRIYGEKFPRGGKVFTHEAAPPPKIKPKVR